MIENALHSLEVALISYDSYKRKSDKWKLKECILFLHHAIELFMKQILFNKNILFLFENFNKAIDGQIRANNNNLDIFTANPKLNTVSYKNSIKRISAILNPPEFKPPINLKDKFEDLNIFRNKIEHFSIEVEEKSVIQLIESLYRPVINFFQKYLKMDIESQISQNTKKVASKIQDYMKNFKEVLNLVKKVIKFYENKAIYKEFFTGNRDLDLRDLVIKQDITRLEHFELDLLLESETEKLIIEMETTKSQESFFNAINRIIRVMQELNSRVWIIFSSFDLKSSTYSKFERYKNLYITDRSRWKELLNSIEN